MSSLYNNKKRCHHCANLCTKRKTTSVWRHSLRLFFPEIKQDRKHGKEITCKSAQKLLLTVTTVLCSPHDFGLRSKVLLSTFNTFGIWKQWALPCLSYLHLVSNNPNKYHIEGKANVVGVVGCNICFILQVNARRGTPASRTASTCTTRCTSVTARRDSTCTPMDTTVYVSIHL